MDEVTKSLLNPSTEILFWGGTIGITIGVLAALAGIIAMIIGKKKKIQNKWGWWLIGLGAIAIVTGISTLLRG